MVVGVLRSSRVYSSKSKETLTRSPKELVEGRATLFSAPQTLLPPSPWQVYLTTPLHSTLTSTLTTLVTPSLVFSKVSIVYTSILILQTLIPTSTTLLVTRDLAHTTQVSSTAHMYLSRWFAPSVRTPSSQRLASRLVTVSLRTHSQKEPIRVSEDFLQTRTVTTDVSRLQTSCDHSSHISWGSFGIPFFMQINKNKTL